MDELLKVLHFDEKGLIPAIIQDEASGKVLTLCYMDEEAIRRTLGEGKVYVYRRSKGRVMMKGTTSGHIQLVKEVYVDCEENSLLFRVGQKVAACHKGYFTCYFRSVSKGGKLEIVERRIVNNK